LFCKVDVIHARRAFDGAGALAGLIVCTSNDEPRNYLIPTTIESGPTSGSTRVDENPASRIQPEQSAPV
jgi:hypothetical protein